MKKYGQSSLSAIDDLEWSSPELGGAIDQYLGGRYVDRQSNRWGRSLNWIQNFLFGLGHHYVTDILVNRLKQDSSDNLYITDELINSIPQPVSELLGRYIETNIALLTENRPIPRITAISDNLNDIKAAELSELTVNYLWEELKQAEKHRDIARLLMYTGLAFNEICYDPLVPRYMPMRETRTEPTTPLETGNQIVNVPIPREVPVINPQTGQFQYTTGLEYGDIVSNAVSPFEMYFPSTHDWNSEDMGWVMKETFVEIDAIKSKFMNPAVKQITKKTNGYFLDNLDKVGTTDLTTLPLWWWERFSDVVEGPNTYFFSGRPENYEGFSVMRVFDRKPSPKWPKGRTVITLGDKLIYDSPKNIGARAFDSRWPKRWHPYIRYRWEAIPGSIYGRSLVGKLLPCIKRINSIDTVLIMWRRTVPIATWLAPKGCLFPGTYVALCSGKVQKIEDIQVGDKVQSLGSIQSVNKIFKYDNDEKAINLKAAGLLPICGTSNHKVPIIRGTPEKRYQYKKGYPYTLIRNKEITEAELGSITTKDFILTSFKRLRNKDNKLVLSKYYKPNKAKKLLSPVIQIDQKFLRLAGLFLAEGNVIIQKNKISGIKLVFSKEEFHTLAEEAVCLIRDIFGLKASKKIEIDKNNFSRTVVKIGNVSLGHIFNELFGRGAKNISIHEDIFYSNVSLLPMVGAWIDGDGCYHKPSRGKKFRHLCARSISINLINQMRGILFDEKIVASTTEDSRGRKNTIYSLRFSSTAIKALKDYCKKIDDNVEVYKVCEQGYWVGDYYAFRVKEIKEIEYSGPVYDLEIENKHYYQANNITVHNSNPIEDFFSGRPGSIWEYDPNRTARMAPEPVYPPPFPETALRERDMMIAQMESISGTEQILKGERPVGTTSATMLDALRKQALASRSAILQSWDQSLEEVGTAMIQETIRHIREDKRYQDRIAILAREKTSKFQIEEFSGTNLSDNVQVRIDTASEAMVSREAKQQRALELIQYGPGLKEIEPGLRAKLVADLGWPDVMVPQGPDIDRGRNLIHYIKSKRFDLVIPSPEDDPYVIHELLVNETKQATFMDLEAEVQLKFFELIKLYQLEIEQIEQARLQFQQTMLASAQAQGPPKK